MKNYLLLVIIFLFTSFGYGREFKVQTYAPVYQPMMENSKPSTNHFSSIKRQKRSYIDTADDELRALPKSKPKRHLFAKTVLGLAGTFVVVVMIVWAIYGGPEFKY
jgi:hypothetical protein